MDEEREGQQGGAPDTDGPRPRDGGAPDVISSIVVVGASAGGIEAISALLETLPADFPAPVVIAQHLDPRRPSHLAEILARRSALPVRTVEDHEALAAGVAFVVPADQHVTIDGQTLGLDPNTYGRPKPSVDVLFRTAANVFGEGAIAVILSGTGSDGADGARAIKEAGGAVVVQDPATASHPGMPSALAPTMVDIVAPLELLGPALAALLARSPSGAPPVHATATDATEGRALRALLEQVRERSGVDFAHYKEATIGRRLQRRIVATGNADLAAYIRYLQAHPEEYDRLVGSFLIKMTRFFRDREVFDLLQGRILPELVAGLSARDELRLWSAGCATGEEAYTLAILVAETMGSALDSARVRIFATDLDPAAVAFARRGVYSAAALADLPPALVERYFLARDGSYEVIKRIRGLVVFGEHDLAERAPFPRIDLCLCRNVLIYFTPALQRRALQLFALALRDGGYLVLGRSESTSPMPDVFATADAQLKVYRRYGERVQLPQPGVMAAPVPPAALGRVTRALAPSLAAPQPAERPRTSLLAAPLGMVTVDRRYDIEAINPAARRLLAIHGAAVGDDLLHLVATPVAAVLRPLIDAALAGETPAPVVATLPGVTTDDVATDVHIACYDPEGRHGAAAGGSPRPRGGELAILLLTNVTGLAEQGRARASEAAEAGERAARLEADLAASHAQAAADQHRLRALLQANDELAMVNEELREENETLLISGEEAQAATEEVETLNEELQATNEELQTLNEELQATVEELNTTNDDLQMRNVESGEMANQLEAQRVTNDGQRMDLAVLLLARDDAVVVVDAAGRPALGNAVYARLTGAIDADFAPHDTEGRPLPSWALPQRRAAAGETVAMEVTITGADGAPRRYTVTGEPLGEPLGADGASQGAVLVIHDRADRADRADDGDRDGGDV